MRSDPVQRESNWLLYSTAMEWNGMATLEDHDVGKMYRLFGLFDFCMQNKHPTFMLFMPFMVRTIPLKFTDIASLFVTVFWAAFLGVTPGEFCTTTQEH